MEKLCYDALRLENQLSFPLYACSREFVKRYTPMLDELGLTYTQYLAMLLLWERGSASVKELGRSLYLDSGTLTPLLKKLEAKGLVTRERSKTDERSLIVTLTTEGEAMKDRAVAIPTAIAQSVALEPEEIITLYRLLYKLLAETNPEPF